MLGLFIAMADNYSLDLYPKLSNMSIFYKILAYLLSPYYVVKNLIVNLQLKYRTSSFRLDPDLKRTGVKKAVISNEFSFTLLNKIAKTYNLTFNDLLTSIISKVSKKVLQSYNSDRDRISKITVGTTMSMRTMPQTLKEHQIINDSQGQIFDLPLIDDPIKQGKKIKKLMIEKLKNPFIAIAGKLLENFVAYIMPYSIMASTIVDTSQGIDIYVSNVPGPNKELYYSGIRASKSMYFANSEYVEFLPSDTYV